MHVGEVLVDQLEDEATIRQAEQTTQEKGEACVRLEQILLIPPGAQALDQMRHQSEEQILQAHFEIIREALRAIHLREMKMENLRERK